MDSTEDLVLVVSVLLGLLLLTLIMSWVNKGVRRVFKKAAMALNADVSRSRFGTPRVEGHYEDVPFRILYEHGGQGYTAKVRVRILKVPGFELFLKDMRTTNKFGSMKEQKIRVPDFDDQFFIRTNDEARCVSYLSSSENRDCIKRIFDQGWRAEFGKEWIELTRAC